ncbi:hypothetical protein [Paraburkholderia podalyriae]|uniref:hypothetical protein n=1 Tax=Paraburkholderia podalyriae TaxID=1938811 RepID=UPI001FEA21E9|nr:hypothetical protein [Paraburkholderia podalyriae]
MEMLFGSLVFAVGVVLLEVPDAPEAAAAPEAPVAAAALPLAFEDSPPPPHAAKR